MCKGVFTYQTLFSLHSIEHIHICSFAVFLQRTAISSILESKPLEQITIFTICCPAAAWSAFQDNTLPCYFVGVHFVCINASPGHKLIFRQLISCPNNVSFTQYNNSQCIFRSREALAIVQWSTLTPSWSFSKVGYSLAGLGSIIEINFKNKCCRTESVCGPNNSAGTRMAGKQKMSNHWQKYPKNIHKKDKYMFVSN